MAISTWRRRIAALLILPFLLVLAGCGKFDGTIEVKDADTLHLTFLIGIDKSMGDMAQITSSQAMCDTFTENQDGITSGPDRTTPVDDPDMYACEVEGTTTRDTWGSGIELTESDGEYHLVLDASSAGMTGDDASMLTGLDFNLKITFPGKVVSSSTGTIDGNSVVFTDIDELMNGVDITAKKSSSGLLWIVLAVGALIGLVVLGALILGAVLLLRRRGKSTPVAAPGGYGAGASAPAAPAAYGAPSPAAPPAAPGGYGASSPGAPSPYGSPQSAPQTGGASWAAPSAQPPAQPPASGSHAAPPQGGQAPQAPGMPSAPGAPAAPGAPQQGQPWQNPPQGGQAPQAPQPWDRPQG
ncbi:proline-rich domain-containing protein [Brachybacterium nesterenkovii]|uniref:Fe-S oxidoreductase n=1 Tax=Brachybacterium nesterenkovii TaxID=47847 RepID=A0A1X6X654_9MICO|nr:proline-rich domain-containing protein [Brachybacterium nesterenkovii]SLM94794.1 Fe-S oxidoreductase [Brachybacterium nesterenkovii]